MKKNFSVITCPYCGAEYLPSEIYIPRAFFGDPGHVDRTFDGKVLEFDGQSMDLEETYKCDCCDNQFQVTASVKFSTKTNNGGINFNEDYVSPIKRIKKISLFEDD